MQVYHLANPLQHGEVVKQIQKALKAAKLYNGPIDGIFGQGTAQAAKRAKYRLGYPISSVAPTAGQQLLDYLRGTAKLPPAYVLRRHARGYGISKNEKLREHVVANARWGIAHEPQIHYTEDNRRDDALHGPIRPLPLWTDCSGFATLCYKWADGPDPNGLKFRALGYTGTMLDYGVTIPLHEAQPGDCVIWGRFPGHHTALLLEDGTSHNNNPLLCSHGSEGGPREIFLIDETKAQAGFGAGSYVVKRYIGI